MNPKERIISIIHSRGVLRVEIGLDPHPSRSIFYWLVFVSDFVSWNLDYKEKYIGSVRR